MVAAALWYPYRALPAATGCAPGRAASYARLRAPGGRRGHRGADAARHRGAPRPDRRPVVGRARCPTLERARPPAGYADGWTFTAPVVEMPVYLRWLRRAGRRARRHADPDEPRRAAAAADRTWWSTAPGSGSRRLARDPTCTRCAGQVVLVEQVGLDRWWLDAARTDVRRAAHRDTSWSAAPRSEGDWSRDPVPGDGRPRSSRGPSRLVPELAGARVVGHRVGLRPARPARAPGGAGPGRALLRPGRRRRDAQLGLRGRGRGAGRRSSLTSRLRRPRT